MDSEVSSLSFSMLAKATDRGPPQVPDSMGGPRYTWSIFMPHSVRPVATGDCAQVACECGAYALSAGRTPLILLSLAVVCKRELGDNLLIARSINQNKYLIDLLGGS